MIPADFRYEAPASLDGAVALLIEHGEDARPLAGGQSLLPLMKLRLATPSVLVDLARIPGLAGIRLAPTVVTHDGRDAETGGQQRAPVSGGLVIGAMTPYYQIEGSDIIQRECPLLSQTASAVADVQVRNRGTLGGSLAHADPTGDMAAAVLALDAELTAFGPAGERLIPAIEFFTGIFSTSLGPDEIVTAIRVPGLSGWSTAYAKAAPRASSFAVAGVAVCLRQRKDGFCDEIRIGVTGVSDRPYRATDVEEALRGNMLKKEVIEEAASAITEAHWVMDDVRASAQYRSHLARIYASRAIQAARDAIPVR